MSNPNITTPKTIESHTVYEGHFNLKEELIKLPSGLQKIYTVLECSPDAVVILAETATGQLVLIKEYRQPTKKWLYGAPGGCIDPGETLIQAAQRELLEETGYTAKNFHLIGSAYPFPSACTQCIYYFLAKDANLTHPTALDPFECIQVELKDPTLLLKEIKEGAVLDGILCSALYFRENFHAIS